MNEEAVLDEMVGRDEGESDDSLRSRATREVGSRVTVRGEEEYGYSRAPQRPARFRLETNRLTVEPAIGPSRLHARRSRRLTAPAAPQTKQATPRTG